MNWMRGNIVDQVVPLSTRSRDCDIWRRLLLSPPCPPLKTTSNMSASTITSKAAVRAPFLYSLDMECPVPWPSQTDSINQDYPFQYVSLAQASHRSKLRGY